MPVVINSVDQTSIEDDGGYELIIKGTFFANESATVKLISAGLVEYLCTASRSGKGTICQPLSATVLTVASPILPIGVYSLRVEQTSGFAVLPSALTVFIRNWKSRTFEMRRLLSPKYKTGPRNLDNVNLL